MKKEEVKKYRRKLYGKIHNKTVKGVKMYQFIILENVMKESVLKWVVKENKTTVD
jgi:hypothetical protein